jgi:hypothetical protein
MFDERAMAADSCGERHPIDVPNADDATDARGGQQTIVGTEGGVHVMISLVWGDVGNNEVRGLLSQCADRLTRETIPQPGCAIDRCRGDRGSVMVEECAVYVAPLAPNARDHGPL